MTLERLWRELENSPPGPTQLVTRRLEGRFPCDVYAGLEWPERLRTVSFEFPTSAVPPRLALRSARGFAAELQRLSPGPAGRVRLLIRLTRRHFADVFTAFVEDLARHVSAAASEGAAVSAIASRLERWQRFFDDSASEGLSPERQCGLFGELWMIHDRFVPWIGASAVVAGWSGPEGAPQDFQFASTGIEVKTTTTRQHQDLEIASERQLDATGLGRLYLGHLSLDVREGGDGLSLPALIARVRADVSPEPLASGLLEEALLSAGYLDVHAERYDGTHYTCRAHQFFEVRDEFPRILETDLRPGVGSVKYTINVAACGPYKVDDDAVCARVREHLHD